MSNGEPMPSGVLRVETIGGRRPGTAGGPRQSLQKAGVYVARTLKALDGISRVQLGKSGNRIRVEHAPG